MKAQARRRRTAVIALICLAVLGAAAGSVRASDHADPMILKEPDANITDLFFFPDGDRYVVVFDVRRSLTALPPYRLENYEYRIYFDLHTPIGHADDAMNARYGGSVNAATLNEDRDILVRLKNDGTVKEVVYHRDFGDTRSFQAQAGVFDDPFNFPRFYKKNAVAMIISIPKAAFPPDQSHFILWGATFKGDKKIDHVGRSNRTQQARFETLNTLHPREHLDAIMKNTTRSNRLFMWLNRYRETQPYAGAVQLLQQTRGYDRVPDVLVYSTQFPDAVYSTYFPTDTPGGFPNGRRLEDDVAARTCAVGDCILQELSFIEGGWPRQTTNDKPFSKTFPYLAAPWKEGDPGLRPTPPPAGSIWRLLIIVLLVLVLILGILIYYAFLGWKYKRLRRRQYADAVL